MPINVRIIHAHDFIKATAEGVLDRDESKKLLLATAAASAHLADYDIVLDTRKAQSELSVADLWYLADELSQHFSKSSSQARRTAVLCPRERFDQAGFFALCAQNRGAPISAFTSADDAYEWLNENRA